METKREDINLKALFIGDKSENGDFYKEMLNELIDDHLGWRKNYMTQDLPAISFDDQSEESFFNNQKRMKTVIQ